MAEATLRRGTARVAASPDASVITTRDRIVVTAAVN
jgi:hypothetical protein